MCHVAAEAEVWVLIDSTRDQCGDVAHRGSGAEDVGEGCGEGRRRLDRCEVELADVVAAGLLAWER